MKNRSHTLCVSLCFILWLLSANTVSSKEAHRSDGVAARVIGGEPSTVPYPWMVSLQELTTQGWFHFCGGTLIGPSTVLTAAHCVNRTGVPNRPMRVVVGGLDLANNLGAQFANVEFIVQHPDFQREYFIHDLAVLHLDQTLSHEIISLPAASDGGVYQRFLPGQRLLVTGWGAVSFNPVSGFGTSNQLQEALIPLVDQSFCRQKYAETLTSVTDQMFCASQEQPLIDTCRGDSGGPIVIQSGGGYQQLGLVSFGSATCNPAELPGVFADVAFYHSFIAQAQRGPVFSLPTGFEGQNRAIDLSVALSSWHPFSVTGVVEQGSRVMALDLSDCTREVAQGNNCFITLSLDTSLPGEVDELIRLAVSSPDPDGATEIGVQLSGWVLNTFAQAETVSDSRLGSQQWFTGGDLPWSVAPGAEARLQAGALSTRDQDSVLVLYAQGPAVVSFQNLIPIESRTGLLEVSMTRVGGILPIGALELSGIGDWACGEFEFNLADEYKLTWRFQNSSADVARPNPAALLRRVRLGSCADQQPVQNSGSGGVLDGHVSMLALLLLLIGRGFLGAIRDL